MRGPDRARRLLVIPDAHAHGQYSNERFTWLGRLIAHERPDVVVCLGDFADMPALSNYDKGKRGFEGRRYKRDVEATRDALQRMHAPVTHAPELLMCLGNHEARIDRAANDAPELEGTISTQDLGYAEHGWRVAPYQTTVSVAGFAFSHHFASGVAGRPIGGMNQAAQMTRLLFTSAVVGHSHIADSARRTRPDGSRVLCISAGCYTPADMIEGWNLATHQLWWRGVLIMEDARDGDCGELRWVSQDRMRELYGGDDGLADSAGAAGDDGPGGVGHDAPAVSAAVQPAPVSNGNGHIGHALDVEHMASTGNVRVKPCNFAGCEDCYPQQSSGGLDYDDVADTQIGPPRVAAPQSRRAFAESVGVPESTLRDWERREGKPWWEYKPAV
jgi:predicted phosphodiesterase